MIPLLIILLLAALLLLLIRRGLLEVDLSLPWFLALLILAAASLNRQFVEGIAAFFGILYAPIAIILIVVFILLGLIATLALAVSRLRQRQVALTRHLAQHDLRRYEKRPAPGEFDEGGKDTI